MLSKGNNITNIRLISKRKCVLWSIHGKPVDESTSDLQVASCEVEQVLQDVGQLIVDLARHEGRAPTTRGHHRGDSGWARSVVATFAFAVLYVFE